MPKGNKDKYLHEDLTSILTAALAIRALNKTNVHQVVNIQSMLHLYTGLLLSNFLKKESICYVKEARTKRSINTPHLMTKLHTYNQVLK